MNIKNITFDKVQIFARLYFESLLLSFKNPAAEAIVVHTSGTIPFKNSSMCRRPPLVILPLAHVLLSFKARKLAGGKKSKKR